MRASVKVEGGRASRRKERAETCDSQKTRRSTCRMLTSVGKHKHPSVPSPISAFLAAATALLIHHFLARTPIVSRHALPLPQHLDFGQRRRLRRCLRRHLHRRNNPRSISTIISKSISFSPRHLPSSAPPPATNATAVATVVRTTLPRVPHSLPATPARYVPSLGVARSPDAAAGQPALGPAIHC
ncbi:hypothetical protein A0H81_01251 [Grifola frondosa]|uniref:Uncharacterized protein n=1 Tax=Grifola frondosa TaxID=5627 RepID=A0A1C7MP07_GRIFR|nr:hypothetical protein A0H81_01251 [Grifola frondosa]